MPEQAEPLLLTQTLKVGENDCGYEFGVGLADGLWLGFAVAALDDGQQVVFIMPQVFENGEMGLRDRGLAIRLTGAVACDPESAYGGIDRWFVPEEQRGKPEDFRCGHCGVIGCDGRECEDELDYEENQP